MRPRTPHCWMLTARCSALSPNPASPAPPESMPHIPASTPCSGPDAALPNTTELLLAVATGESLAQLSAGFPSYFRRARQEYPAPPATRLAEFSPPPPLPARDLPLFHAFPSRLESGREFRCGARAPPS